VVSERQVGWCDAAERRCRNSESAGEDGCTKVAEKYWYVVTLQRSKRSGAGHQFLGRHEEHRFAESSDQIETNRAHVGDP